MMIFGTKFHIFFENTLLFRRVSDMVFDNNEYDRDANRNNAVARIQALRAASCVKVLGKGVIRVVRRVDDATENKNLGEFCDKKGD